MLIDKSGFDPLLLERAASIRMLVLDVDGVLTDGTLYFDNNGNEMKAFSSRDGLGLRCLQLCGIELALITGQQSAIIDRRAEQLGIMHVYQGRKDKLNAFIHLLEKTGIDEQQVCYAGDDWIDLPVLERVGLAVTVPDADKIVKDRVHWVTSHRGGKGAVREICNLVLAAQGLDKIALDELLKLNITPGLKP
ncbi:MAG: 3-deoxy-manno-octulosonate-8-phosphatase KdsC [Xanthomonadales bacterium]